MPLPPSSHPCIVTFAGVQIGALTGFDSEAQAGQLQDVTHGDSQVVGYGEASRVLKEWDCTSIESATASFQFWGPPSFAITDVGMRGLLTFSAPGNTYSGEAILTRWSHSGRKGEFATGSCSFQLTGRR